MGWVLRWRSHSTPEAQRVYYIQLNREVEILQLQVHREAGYYIQINKEVGLLHTADQGGRFCRGAVFRSQTPRAGGRYRGHFPQTLSTFTLRRQESFDTPIGPFAMTVLMFNNAHSLRIYLFPALSVLGKGTGPSGPLVGGKQDHAQRESSPKWLCPDDRRQAESGMGWVSFYMQWAATERLK